MEKYLKLKIKTDDNEITRILEAKHYILAIAGRTLTIISKEDNNEVDKITLLKEVNNQVEVDLLPEDDKFVFKQNNETKEALEIEGIKIVTEPVSSGEAEIVSGVTGATALVSEAASVQAKTEINKYVKLSEEIARATTDSIKIQLESLHKSGTLAKPVILPATAYTKMFVFLSKLNVSKNSTENDVIKEVTMHLNELEDVVNTIAKDSEHLEGDVWVKLEKEDLDIKRILKMLDSKAITGMIKEISVEVKNSLKVNDPEKIMRAYAKTVRLVGLISPGVIGDNPEGYYSRIDKILLGKEEPKNRLEHIIKKVFMPEKKVKEVKQTLEKEEKIEQPKKVAESVGA